MWHEISIPDCPSPIRGYSHVDLGLCFVATTDGLFVLCLDPTPNWQRIGDGIEEHMLFDDELITFNDAALFYRDVRFALHGFPLLDDVDYSDIPLDTHPTGQRLTYDPQTDSALILHNESEFQRIDLGITEEWTPAGFSSDGRHLTFASLAWVRVFEFRP